MAFFIGIDLGGTNARGALVDDKGTIVARARCPAGSKREPAAILADLAGLVTTLAAKTSEVISGYGFGIPGIVAQATGLVYRSPHFPGLREYPIRVELIRALGHEVFVDNDANAYLRGEAWQGAARGHRNVILLTLGTGIGGALMIAGSVWHGDRGFAGEIGHMVIETEGLPCPCGGRGCFEQYASASALLRMSREQGTPRLPQELAAAAGAGDKEALELFHRFGTYLGIGIASLVNITGIHTVILGGGVAGAWDYFIAATQEEFAARIYTESARSTQIIPATLGDDAGILGAAYGARYQSAIS